MKKTFGMLLAALLVLSTMGGCGPKVAAADSYTVIEESEQPLADTVIEAVTEETVSDEKEDVAVESASIEEVTVTPETNTTVRTAARSSRTGRGRNNGGNSNNNNSSNTGSNTGSGNAGSGSTGSGNSGSSNQGSAPANTPVTLNVTEHQIQAGPTPDVNPLKGLIPFSGETTFPISMEWFYIAVNEVEVAEGVYDWSALESRLNTIAGRGHQAVLRFYYDYPGESTGVPQYLIDDYHLNMRPYNEPGNLGGSGLCPDYSDVHFRTSMANFIAAFGEEYDGDPRIGFITEGLLGFWGEWHNWPFDEDTSDGKPNWNIPSEVYTEVYSAFNNAFHTTKLVVREPKDGVDDPSFHTGYHDDSFAYATLSEANGGQSWSFMQRLINQGVQNNWQFGCIGGEVYPPLQGSIFTGNTTGDTQNWQACVNETHASWLMCDQIKGYSGNTRTNAINASKGLGYDLQVVTASYSETIGGNTSLPVSVGIKNNGVAPFYYDHNTWPVMIGVKQGDTLVKKYYTTWDLNSIPANGNIVSFNTNIENHGLGNGNFTLCIKVQNPLSGGVLLSFSNAGQGADGWLSLGSFTVSNAGNVNYDPVGDDNGPGETPEPEPTPDGVNGLYEAERGTLYGKATLSDNYKASNGKMVGWIGTGDGESGSFSLDHIEVSEAGAYTVEIAYVLGEDHRTATLEVNGGVSAGGETVTVNFTSTGGWTTLGTKLANVNLRQGVNTILVHNDTGYAPDMDYFKFTKGYTEITEPETPDTGSDHFTRGFYTDWSSVDPIYTNDSQTIWVKDDTEYVYFATEYKYSNLQHWQVMIDADGNSGTGMTSTWPFAPGGIDYMVEGDLNGGNLAYKSTSDGEWSWDYTAYVEEAVASVVDAGNKCIEVRIKKAALNKSDRPLAATIGVGLRYIDGDWGEIGSSNGAEVLSYSLSNQNAGNNGGSGNEGGDTGNTGNEGGNEQGNTNPEPGAIFPGTLNVWNGVNAFYSDSIMEIYVTDDADYLYVGVTGVPESTYPYYAIEFNTDGNTATGYQIDWVWQPGSTGSDFVIESGLLRQQTTNNTSWAPLIDVQDGLSYYSLVDGVMEIKIPKNKLVTAEKTLASTIGIGMELKDSDWCLVHSSNYDDMQSPMATYSFKH